MEFEIRLIHHYRYISFCFVVSVVLQQITSSASAAKVVTDDSVNVLAFSGLSHAVFKAITRKGYRLPTPIQRKVLQQSQRWCAGDSIATNH